MRVFAWGLVSMLLLGCAEDPPPSRPDATVADAPTVDTSSEDVSPDAPDAPDAPLPPFCTPPTPGPEALRRRNDPARPVLPGNRGVTPAGRSLRLGGFPVDLRVHPRLPLAYIANSGYGRRAVQVVQIETGAVVQEVVRPEVFHGIALSADGSWLYLSAGNAGRVERYRVDDAGRLSADGSVAVTGYPAGLTLSPDGARLWVAQLFGNSVTEIDPAALSVRGSIPLPWGGYQLRHLPTRNELWVTGYADREVAAIDLSTRAVARIVVGGNPLTLAVSADASTVWTAVADGDELVTLDAASRTVRSRTAVVEPGAEDSAGRPLPASSPGALAFDAASGRLYVARAADAAVSVFEAATMRRLGAIPTGWYPTGVALAGPRLVVLNAKGEGAGPLLDYGFGQESGKQRMTGTASIVDDVMAYDLAEGARVVAANVARPREVLGFRCDGTFPVPAVAGGPTPIRHVVLIVRENKTYDSVLGDLGRGNGDRSLVMYGESVTPNLHALARRFTDHDNFYSDGETSVQGHLWLTSSFVNDWVERTWLEDYRGAGGFSMDAVLDRGQPDFGTFFTHLLRHDRPFRIWGEVVGSTGQYMGRSVSRSIDLGFPGIFYNTDVLDVDKARHIARYIAEIDELPRFLYILLPNDHTNGLGPGRLTPESMVADNDEATGILVDALSHSRFWPSTAVFITQDDTQIGGDHVDYHRTVLVVASPWARPGHTSSVHTSFPSLFRTFELILGVPPMNRYDAHATPLWDSFGTTPDFTPFTALPRRVPTARNPSQLAEPLRARRMDFRGPDRNPELGETLWRARFPGRPYAPHGPLSEQLEESREERDAHEAALRAFLREARRHPELGVDPRALRRALAPR
jgi:DNA-binding beta-propeller fold protein YncE